MYTIDFVVNGLLVGVSIEVSPRSAPLHLLFAFYITGYARDQLPRYRTLSGQRTRMSPGVLPWMPGPFCMQTGIHLMKSTNNHNGEANYR